MTSCFLTRATIVFVLTISKFDVAAAQTSTDPPKHRSNFFAKQDCNSSNCHGNKITESPLWNRSGDIWSQHDPHSDAYVGLRTPTSIDIVRKLQGIPQDRLLSADDPTYQQFLEINCVACHASEIAPISQRFAGIDCQSCHGSAIYWGDSHYSRTWQDLKESRFNDPSAKGRINTTSAWNTARVCGSCHVGETPRTQTIEYDDGSRSAQRPREVSHQLMAAGHPPTYFEFGQYLRRYPKHWWDEDLSDDSSPNPESGVSARASTSPSIPGRSLDTWRIGKIVNAKQRIELLENRLGRDEWPELTEHRCTSCHHPLDSNRQDDHRNSFQFAPWDGWYLEQVDLALAITQPSKEQAVVAPFEGDPVESWNKHLTQLKELLLNPISIHHQHNNEKVREHLAVLKKQLDDVIVQERPLLELEKLKQISLQWIEITERDVSRASWETAVQLKLAAQALAYAVDPAGTYPTIEQDTWDLPISAWSRTQPLPYKSSENFDWKQFSERFSELKRILTDLP